jgi:two-component system response regulator CpxR
MERVLIIDDDSELCELVGEYLKQEGWSVDAVHDGTSGITAADSEVYQLIILDVMLPGTNGFDVLRQIRTGSDVPVIMLTARGEEVDRIVGLEIGADDYIPKPFNPRELVARMRAILRRVGDRRDGSADDDGVVVIEWGDTILPALPAGYLIVSFEFGAGDDERTLHLTARGTAWQARLPALRAALDERIAV